jgi:hypothetical protein
MISGANSAFQLPRRKGSNDSNPGFGIRQHDPGEQPELIGPSIRALPASRWNIEHKLALSKDAKGAAAHASRSTPISYPPTRSRITTNCGTNIVAVVSSITAMIMENRGRALEAQFGQSVPDRAHARC